MLKLVFNPISGQFDYVDVTTPSTSSYWGSFYDTTTQTIASTTTEYPVTMNTTVGGNGVAIGSPTSRVVFSNAGVYSITFSLQFDNSGADDQLATVWIKKNGTNVTDSASVTSIPKKHGSDNGAIITTINYVLDLQANDYIQVYWRADSTNVRLVTVAAGSSPTRPLSPSIIYTATLANAIGSKGDTGATGSAGVQGDTGTQGVKGDTGTQGDTGIKGDTGTQGVKGDTGSQGSKGDTGSQGDTGTQGDTGVNPFKGKYNTDPSLPSVINGDQYWNNLDNKIQIYVDEWRELNGAERFKFQDDSLFQMQNDSYFQFQD